MALEGGDRSNEEKTPRRLLRALDVQMRLNVGSIELRGKEHLKEIKPGESVILASSHITDLDMPIMIHELANDLNIAVVDLSTNKSLRANPLGFIGNQIAGRDNFISVDYHHTSAGRVASFNPHNFDPMLRAMESGKTIAIAAQNPTFTGQLGEGAIGAVYLAQLSDAAILPSATLLKTEENLGIDGTMSQLKTMAQRPDAKLTIGAPIRFPKIANIEIVRQLHDKRHTGERATKEDIERFRTVVDELRKQSDELMRYIAEMLPEDKRGSYSAHE